MFALSPVASPESEELEKQRQTLSKSARVAQALDRQDVALDIAVFNTRVDHGCCWRGAVGLD